MAYFFYLDMGSNNFLSFSYEHNRRATGCEKILQVFRANILGAVPVAQRSECWTYNLARRLENIKFCIFFSRNDSHGKLVPFQYPDIRCHLLDMPYGFCKSYVMQKILSSKKSCVYMCNNIRLGPLYYVESHTIFKLK